LICKPGTGRWVAAEGAAVAIPATPGLAWAAEGRPGALPLLIAAAVIALVAGILNAAAAIYEARQQTRRLEIMLGGRDTLAAAVARCLDDAHARAQAANPATEIEEIARVRASAREILTEVIPPVAALVGQAPQRPTDAARPGTVIEAEPAGAVTHSQKILRNSADRRGAVGPVLSSNLQARVNKTSTTVLKRKK